jgi:hypothetical protein
MLDNPRFITVRGIPLSPAMIISPLYSSLRLPLSSSICLVALLPRGEYVLLLECNCPI